MNWKGCKWNRSWPDWRYYTGICVETPRKHVKTHGLNNHCAVRDSNHVSSGRNQLTRFKRQNLSRYKVRFQNRSKNFETQPLTSSSLVVCPSVLPHGTTGLILDGLSRNFVFEYFSKICQENSSFIKIREE